MLNIKTKKSFISKILTTSLLCSIGLLTNIHAQAEETTSEINKTFAPLDNNTSPNTRLNKNNQANNSSKSSDVGTVLFNYNNPNLMPPANKVGTKVSASVTVNENGDVLWVEVYTNDEVLRNSIETAIYNSSPFTPIVGTNIRRLKLNFVVQ